MSRITRRKFLGLSALALPAAMGADSSAFETTTLRVTRLQHGPGPCRFVHFTDFHYRGDADYASESDSSKPVVGSGNSPDSRITPQSRHSTYSASESLAMSCVRGWRQEAGSFTRLLLSCPNHNTRNGM